MNPPDLLDAVGVRLEEGQCVLYASTGIFVSGALEPGVIRRVYISPNGGGQRIVIRRNDGKTVCLSSSKRVVVLRQENEGHTWNGFALLESIDKMLSFLDEALKK